GCKEATGFLHRRLRSDEEMGILHEHRAPGIPLLSWNPHISSPYWLVRPYLAAFEPVFRANLAVQDGTLRACLFSKGQSWTVATTQHVPHSCRARRRWIRLPITSPMEAPLVSGLRTINSDL